MEYFSITEARKKKTRIQYKPFKPNALGIKMFIGYPVQELARYIDWTPFLNGWGLKGIYPDIFQKEKVGNEARRVYREGQETLEKVISKNLIKPKGIIGLYPANSLGDDIIVYDPEEDNQPVKRFPMLRQQMHRGKEESLSLSDFIAPVESGMKDYIGLFTVTAGPEVEAYSEKLKKENDVYNSLMFRFIADRVTEAFAERLHQRVRKEFWGYQPDENHTNAELIREEYMGTRPAPGYPACPDHSLKKLIFDTMQVEEKIGVSLTPDYVMKPVSSVSGFYISHPDSKYFRLGKITRDQVDDYAKRNRMPYSKAEKHLHASIYSKPGQFTDRRDQDN